ncbi:12659_t:CDS:2 [Dentiscutata erythropus]|uniref:12659_t:CDS:1 n=1 Tax=Dentiscutata erythropus TaxID=1348616 RepID=A0A9N8ZZU3_9GLOM|nr:12659_t:CDS:2 [Dentiscutata erythropus]
MSRDLPRFKDPKFGNGNLCQICPQGVILLSDVLDNNSTLIHLGISESNTDPEGDTILVETLSRITTLTSLKLAFNCSFLQGDM